MRESGVGHDESNRPHTPISSSPARDEPSTPSGDNYSSVGSIPPNQEDVGLPHDRPGREFQDPPSPLGPGTPIVSTRPSNPLRLYFRVGRMRFHVSPQDRLDSSNSSVNHYHVIDIDLEMGSDNGYSLSRVVPPMKLGKTFLGLTYQALYSFLIFHYQASGSTPSQDHSPKSSRILLQIAEVNLVVGFAATLVGILLRQAYPEKSLIIERAGSVSAAFGFFLMMSMLLKNIPEWIGWICAVGVLLAFVIAFAKKKID